MAALKYSADVKLVADLILDQLAENFPFPCSFDAAQVANDLGINVQQVNNPPYPSKYQADPLPGGADISWCIQHLCRWLLKEGYVFVKDDINEGMVLTSKGLRSLNLKPDYLPSF